MVLSYFRVQARHFLTSLLLYKSKKVLSYESTKVKRRRLVSGPSWPTNPAAPTLTCSTRRPSSSQWACSSASSADPSPWGPSRGSSPPSYPLTNRRRPPHHSLWLLSLNRSPLSLSLSPVSLNQTASVPYWSIFTIL